MRKIYLIYFFLLVDDFKLVIIIELCQAMEMHIDYYDLNSYIFEKKKFFVYHLSIYLFYHFFFLIIVEFLSFFVLRLNIA